MNDQAIPAATLILVRDTTSGPPELLMVKRAGSMTFAAGAWVFPGGRIDQGDMAFGEATGCDPAAIAAIRETLEETAIPVAISPAPSAKTTHAFQDALVAGEDFAALLSNHSLKPEIESLTAFARWVPTFHAVRRFDTLFFVARCPPGDWSPRVVEGECAEAAWRSAADFLERDQRGDAQLIFPTRRNLERLAKHQSFEQIRAHALAHPIEPISPWVEERGGEQYLTIPDHLGYPVTEEKLGGLWRG